MEFGPILHAMSRNKIGALLIALQMALTMAIVANAVFIIKQLDCFLAQLFEINNKFPRAKVGNVGL